MSIKTDSYITTLSPEILKMAKDEFGEDDHLRENSLIAIRDWIKKQPHLLSSITTGKLCYANYILPIKQNLKIYISIM